MSWLHLQQMLMCLFKCRSMFLAEQKPPRVVGRVFKLTFFTRMTSIHLSFRWHLTIKAPSAATTVESSPCAHKDFNLQQCTRSHIDSCDLRRNDGVKNAAPPSAFEFVLLWKWLMTGQPPTSSQNIQLVYREIAHFSTSRFQFLQHINVLILFIWLVITPHRQNGNVFKQMCKYQLLCLCLIFDSLWVKSYKVSRHDTFIYISTFPLS